MKRYTLLLLYFIILVSCGKKTNEGDTPGNTPTVNFTQIGPATTSAAIITYFACNRKGNAFIVTVIDENNRRQTYAGNGTKWEKLGEFQAAGAAVSDAGVVVYFDHSNTLKRYTGSGSPETVALSGFNYPKVVLGMDGNFYTGSSNGKVYKSTDDGKTWTATDIPQNRFNYAGNVTVGFLVHPDGKMISYLGGGKFYQSSDAGKTWTDVTIAINYSNAGYVDIYSPISHDFTGSVYIQGATGLALVNTLNMSSRSVSFQSAGLNSFEKFERFATDAQGVLYAGATNFGYDYENRKQAAAIYKLDGNTWQKQALPIPYAGFSGMNIQATQAGIISAANGLLSKGLYALDAAGKYTAIGAPQSFENQVLCMAPQSNGKIFCVVRHATPVGSRAGAVLNPAYPSLMVLENGQWKHTGKVSDGVFVASNGNIYSIQNVDASISKDGGTTWQTSTITVNDPLNLRNFLSAEPVHFTELKGEVHVYFVMGFGGVGGAYTNYSWTKAPLGSTSFEKLTGRAGNYDPSLSQVPLVTAARGATGFFYDPFGAYVYYPARDNAVYFTKDGGVSYTPAGNLLPFAGSNSGRYVAWGPGGFVTSQAGNPLSFSAVRFKLPEGEVDMNKFNGANYFKTWCRFGMDNKLYLNIDNKIYGGKEVLN